MSIFDGVRSLNAFGVTVWWFNFADAWDDIGNLHRAACMERERIAGIAARCAKGLRKGGHEETHPAEEYEFMAHALAPDGEWAK